MVGKYEHITLKDRAKYPKQLKADKFGIKTKHIRMTPKIKCHRWQKCGQRYAAYYAKKK
jgi:hypothetical protein